MSGDRPSWRGLATLACLLVGASVAAFLALLGLVWLTAGVLL